MPGWAWLLVGVALGVVGLSVYIVWVFTDGFKDIGMGN